MVLVPFIRIVGANRLTTTTTMHLPIHIVIKEAVRDFNPIHGPLAVGTVFAPLKIWVSRQSPGSVN